MKPKEKSEQKILHKRLLDDEQLFFMHIPKTAGLSLIALLDQHYVDDEICPVHEGYRKFLEYSPEERGLFKFIRGHFPYKLVDVLPRLPRLITFLRDPVKRTLSAISQHKRNEEQGISYFEEKIGHLDIDQFLNHPAFGISVPNVSVKYLNDILGRLSQEKKVMSLARAKERLETFDVIGFTEKFDESLAVLSHTFGFLPILYFPRINVDPSRSANTQIGQNVLDRIAEINRDEIELYEYGMKLFRKRLNQMEVEKAKDRVPEISRESFVRFDFNRVDPGRGWYPAEKNMKHGIVRWSGPQTSSHLNFWVMPNKSYKIRFRVVKAVASDVINNLSLTVNRQKIPLSKQSDRKGGYIFEGRISNEVTTSGNIELIFDVNRTVSLTTIRDITTRLSDLWRRMGFRLRRPRINTIYILDEQEYREGGLLYNWLEIVPFP